MRVGDEAQRPRELIGIAGADDGRRQQTRTVDVLGLELEFGPVGDHAILAEEAAQGGDGAVYGAGQQVDGFGHLRAPAVGVMSGV